MTSSKETSSDIVNELEKQEPNIIDKVPAPERIQLIQQVSNVTGFSGPIPPPVLLKEYNAIDPSFAERIMLMAEREQTHKINIDNANIALQKETAKSRHKIITTQGNQILRGQIFGFVIAVLILVLAFVLIFYNYPLTGFSLIILDVAAIISAFMFSNLSKPKKKRP